MTYLLALDQGATSSSAIVFDSAGAQVTVAQQEFTQYFPQTGNHAQLSANGLLTTSAAQISEKNLR